MSIIPYISSHTTDPAWQLDKRKDYGLYVHLPVGIIVIIIIVYYYYYYD